MFTLKEDHLLQLWELNQFILPKNKWIFFGLRGCLPNNDEDHTFRKEHSLTVLTPDHIHPCCTIGQWAPDKGFAIFPGSTVPHLKHIKRSVFKDGRGTNQLLTGCYPDYRKGIHKNSKPSGHQAFRQDNKLPVRRSADDTDYDTDDRVEYTQPFDNLHAGWCHGVNHTRFASAGCQVIVGFPKCKSRGDQSKDVGPWKIFKENAYSLQQNSFYYVVLTGRDAQRLALSQTQLSPKLRFGSQGKLVQIIQQSLKTKDFYEGNIDSDFGPRTLRSVLDFQSNTFGSSEADGIIGIITASALDIDWPTGVSLNNDNNSPSIHLSNTADNFRFEGNKAIAPDNTQFATKYKKGVFNYGVTSIKTFIDQHKNSFNDTSDSLLNVIKAVSENEGKLEAINTWDNAFLTFGIFQWTLGTGKGTGELPALLVRLKKEHNTVFEEYFGQYELDVINFREGAPKNKGITPSGFCTLKGIKLSKALQKEDLRTLEWAYRFWFAGQNDTVRKIQIEMAMDRIHIFYRSPRHKINNRFISEYINSEQGVALLLDQHVNRPGHVPKTLKQALDCLDAPEDPLIWKDIDEQNLLNIYLELRSKTSMTNSDKRAQTITRAIDEQIISDKRGSFILTTSQ